MSTKTSPLNFEERIEQLVREQIAVVRARAQAAMARAFAESAVARSTPAPLPTKSSPRRPPSRRRAPEQITDLAERLCAAVHAQPGETMVQLAPKVGATPSELSIAVERLRHQGRVRTVGQRQHTRYFPLAPAPTPAA